MKFLLGFGFLHANAIPRRLSLSGKHNQRPKPITGSAPPPPTRDQCKSVPDFPASGVAFSGPLPVSTGLQIRARPRALCYTPQHLRIHMAGRDDNSHQDRNHRKNFDRWNEQKKALNADAEPLYFREGEIWWVHLGVNIGYEIDGKSGNFARPVIVLRKYNKYSFLALPLTTSPRPSPWKLPLGIFGGKLSFAILSQLRNIDSRRLYQKVASLAPELLATIRSETLRANFNAGPSNQK